MTSRCKILFCYAKKLVASHVRTGTDDKNLIETVKIKDNILIELTHLHF